jgi:hypothetical protein
VEDFCREFNSFGCIPGYNTWSFNSPIQSALTSNTTDFLNLESIPRSSQASTHSLPGYTEMMNHAASSGNISLNATEYRHSPNVTNDHTFNISTTHQYHQQHHSGLATPLSCTGPYSNCSSSHSFLNGATAGAHSFIPSPGGDRGGSGGTMLDLMTSPSFTYQHVDKVNKRRHIG